MVTLFRQDVARNVGELDRDAFVVSERVTYSAAPPVPSFDEQARIVSRATITNYLAVLEATSVALALRPFSSRRSNEIIAAPKVYGFDTGFVCAHRGWTGLRPDDLGQLWEHYVLNELTAQLQTAGGALLAGQARSRSGLDPGAAREKSDGHRMHKVRS